MSTPKSINGFTIRRKPKTSLKTAVKDALNVVIPLTALSVAFPFCPDRAIATEFVDRSSVLQFSEAEFQTNLIYLYSSADGEISQLDRGLASSRADVVRFLSNAPSFWSDSPLCYRYTQFSTGSGSYLCNVAAMEAVRTDFDGVLSEAKILAREGGPAFPIIADLGRVDDAAIAAIPTWNYPSGMMFGSGGRNTINVSFGNGIAAYNASGESLGNSPSPGYIFPASFLRMWRTGDLSSSLRVPISLGGSGALGTDYAVRILDGTDVTWIDSSFDAQEVVFPAGRQTVQVAIHPITTTSTHELETVDLSISVPPSYVYGIQGLNPTFSLVVDEEIIPEVTITGGGVLPRGSASDFTVTLSEALPDESLSVSYSVGGTATNGQDVTFLDGDIIFAAGQTTATIPISGIEPNSLQPEEALQLSFADLAAYNISGSDSIRYTLPAYIPTTVDIQLPPETTLTPGATDEGLVLTRSGDTLAPLSVDYAVSGTATSGEDYIPLSGSVTFPAGSATTMIPIAAIDHHGVNTEPSETIQITLESGRGYSLADPALTATFTIPAYTPSTVSLSPSPGTDSILTPGSTSEGFTLSRTGDTSEPLFVNYTVGGTATNGTDYNQLSGVVAIPAGATESHVQLAVRPESGTGSEPAETVTVAIAPGSGYAGDNTGIRFTIPAYNPPVTSEVTISPVNGDTMLTPGGSNDGLEFTRTGDTSQALTVAYGVSGSATNGIDYTFLPGQITIPAGQSSVTVPIAVPVSLARMNAGETVIVSLSAAPNGDYNPGPSTSTSFTIDIPDGVALTTAITTSPPNIKVSRPTDSNLSDPLTISYNVGGTATPGQDYEALPGFVTIPPGQTVATIPLNILETANAGNTVEVAFQPPEGYEVSSQPGVYAITANDIPVAYVPQTVSIAPAPGTNNTLTPGATDEAFVIRRSGGSVGNSSPLTVTYTVSGTATPNDDYVPLSQTAVIPAGIEEMTIPLVAYRNTGAIAETDESIVIVLQAGSGYTLATSTETFIIPGHTPHEVSVAPLVGVTLVTPGRSGSGFMISRRNGDISQPLTVNYTIGGTATPGDDYTPISETVTIPVGATEVSVPVFAYANTGDTTEPDETVSLTLTSGTSDPGYSIGSDNTATLTILGYTPSTVSIASAAGTGTTLTPGATDEGFTISRTGDAREPLFVNYTVGGSATNGTDYNQLSGIAAIPVGSSSTTVQLMALPDSGDSPEPEETVALAIAPGSGYAGDNTGISFTIPAYTPTETPMITLSASNGDTMLTPGNTADGLTVTRSGDTSEPLTIPLDIGGSATNGADYTMADTVTIPAGASSATVSISVPADISSTNDGETVTVSLPPSGDGGYTAGTNTSTTFTIDASPEDTPIAAATTSEPPGVKVARPSESDVSEPLAIPYTVTGTATPGDDYEQLPGFVTIPPGQSTATIPFNILASATPGETIGLSFDSPAGYSVDQPGEYAIALDDIPQTPELLLEPSIGREPSEERTDGIEIPSGTIPVITVTRDPDDPGVAPLNIPYTVHGSALPGEDYVLLPGSVTIPAGLASVDIPIELLSEAISGRRIEVEFSSPRDGFGFTSNQVEYVIDDRDVPQALAEPVSDELILGLEVSESSDANGDGTTDIVFTVSRPEGDPGTTPITLAYTVGGSAIPGEDYVPLSGTITIPAGQDTGQIIVDVLPTATPGRTVEIIFDDPDGYDVANEGQVLATIPEQVSLLPGEPDTNPSPLLPSAVELPDRDSGSDSESELDGNSDGSEDGDNGGGIGAISAVGALGAVTLPFALGANSGGGLSCPADPLPDALMAEVQQVSPSIDIDWTQIRFDGLPNQNYLLSDFPRLGDRPIRDIATVGPNQTLGSILGPVTLDALAERMPDVTVGEFSQLTGIPAVTQTVSMPLNELAQVELDELLAQYPALGTVDLSQLAASDLPRVGDLEIDQIPDWENRTVSTIPGMVNMPFSRLFPCLNEALGRNDGEHHNVVDQQGGR